MKRVILITTPLSLVLLSACAVFSNATQANLRDVKIGQTVAEVENRIGKPQSEYPSGEEIRCTYEIYSDDRRSSYYYIAIFHRGLLQNIYFDSGENAYSSELIRKRSESKKESGSLPFAAPDGSPPMR